jgi:uncharacterized protein
MADKCAPKVAPEERTMETARICTREKPVLLPAGQPGAHNPNKFKHDMTDRSDTIPSTKVKKIWIDLDNSPHVPFFLPIIKSLQKSGHEVVLTARDSYQVCELLEFYAVKAQVVGKHYGKQKVLKVLGTILRSGQLLRWIRSQNVDISLSHGSRACTIASHLLGIPTVVLGDYEFTSKLKILGPNWMVFPEIVPDESISSPGLKILKYPGIKEDVYVSNLRPDPGLRARFGVGQNDLLITVRPPAQEAHYHNPESDILLVEALRKFSGQPGVKILLLPRNKRQEADLREAWASEIAAGHILIPGHVEDGLNIIWNSDLVISGGGTMNREAAALGVPVYSIFRGKTGAVDRYLSEKGRLIMLENVDDVHSKLVLARRDIHEDFLSDNRPALKTIMTYVETILASKDPASPAAPEVVQQPLNR